MVVRNDRKVQFVGNRRGEAVAKVDGEKRLARLDDYAHVIDVPDGGRVARHLRLAHLAHHLPERLVVAAQDRVLGVPRLTFGGGELAPVRRHVLAIDEIQERLGRKRIYLLLDRIIVNGCVCGGCG